jgi:LysR family hydrogen peroxide-inducible transcriptional activator
MVGTGVGLALLPEIYIRSEAGGLEVVAIAEPEGWAEYRSVAAAWRASAAMAQVYSEISDLVAQVARERLGQE